MPKKSTKTKKTTAKKKTAPAKKAAPKKSVTKKAVSAKTVKATRARTTKRGEKKLPFKKEMTQKLLEAKSKILQEVTHKIRSESNVHKFEIGDIYDIASSERERELALTLGDRDRGKLSEIEDALERLNDSTYGTCEECGEPIAEKRLKVLPFTRVCIECQSRSERDERIKGRFEEETGLGIMEKSDTEDEEF